LSSEARQIARERNYGCSDLTKDKVLLLGTILKEICEAKLQCQFPDRPCKVSLYEPPDETDLMAYEITFWQLTNESRPA
jgi:hypothetical protein